MTLKTIRDLSLELSLKPFTAADGSDIDAVFARLFRQYEDLVRQGGVGAVTLMFWTSDGSEILDYAGDLDTAFPWGDRIGCANPLHTVPNDPEGIDPHSRSYPYRDASVPLTYRRLARIVAAGKTVGRRLLGVPIRACATFDPGPEFAVSDFKYGRHAEICMGKLQGVPRWVSCYAILKGEARAYAAFPDGIPEGLPFGTFLGAQARHFLDDLGFDALWLSNGFGFGIETWSAVGPLFDGTRFDAGRREECRTRILDFWRRFRAECPAHEIRVRGTNLTTGIDLASDGAPLAEIYTGGFLQAPPPNSPWAALDGNFGLELAGWMSHIAELPGDEILFRYYLHDPWWKNSPWLDRYGREAHDLWLPLSICRLDREGAVRTPTRISFLTVDDSYGRMPDRVPREVTPLLLDALEHAPDAPPPLVWAYPFAEYHDRVFGATPRLEEPFAGDWLIAGAINEGLPVGGVVSTTNLVAIVGADPQRLRGSVLLTPVPDAESAAEGALLAHLMAGGRALCYGSTVHAGPRVLAALGLAHAEAISGDLVLHAGPGPDRDVLGERIFHRPEINAGGIIEVLAASAGSVVLAEASNAGQRRVVGVLRTDPSWSGGALAWVRGTVSASCRGGYLLTQDDPRRYRRSEVLVRHALASLGWTVGVQRRRVDEAPTTSGDVAEDAPWDTVMYDLAAAHGSPVVGVHRHRRAFWFSGFQRDTTTTLRLRFPDGAPLLVGCDAWLADGVAEYTMPKAWRRECRVFVDQAAPGRLSCVEGTAEQVDLLRRIWVRGLRDATVTIHPPPGATLRVLGNPPWPWVIGEAVAQERRADGAVVCRGVSGTLSIAW